jgi:hypothetical protein
MTKKENHSKPLITAEHHAKEDVIMDVNFIKNITENALMKLAATVYECEHQNENALYQFARWTGKSKKHLEQVAGGKGSCGFCAWLIIEEHLPMPLYTIWCDMQKDKNPIILQEQIKGKQ